MARCPAPGSRAERTRAYAGAGTAGRPGPGRAPQEDGHARPNPGEAVRITARSFVLATGKYLAGGIRADDRFLEPALGCPVWVEYLGSTYDAPDPLALTHPDREADQPLLRAGVRTDDAGRPVDRRGDVVYENVRVAGTVRSGIDAAAPGLGHAAADGWRAGELAAEDV